MRRLIPTVLVMICAAAAPATANWRDGCPAIDVPRGTTARQLFDANHGSSADIDSALGPTRLTLALRGAYFMSRAELDRARMYTALGHLALNLPPSVRGVALPRGTRFGLSLTAPFASSTSESTRAGADDEATASSSGNVVVGVYFRYDYLADGWRGGFALRLIHGRATSDAGSALRDELAARSPLEPQLFSPGVSGLIVERRGELRGCYAPFFHLRLGALHHPAAVGVTDARATYYSALATFAAGAHLSQHVATFAQAGIQVDSPQNALARSSIRRFRLGLEWWKGDLPRGSAVALGGHLDLLAGAFDGLFAGFDVTFAY